jgi:hypothetical protein
VDIAEHLHDPGFHERYALGCPGSVEGQVEGLPAEIRKDVVIDGVEVGKHYGAARGNRHHVGGEDLVFLLHLGPAGRGRRSRMAYRFEPQHHARIVVPPHRRVARVGEFHLPAYRARHGQRGREIRKSKPAPDHSGC